MIRMYQRDFRAWLEKRQGSIVGDPISPSACPLCKFLKSQGAKSVRMNVTCRTVDGERSRNSAWMVRFQDNAMKMKRDLNVRGLRGREALKALEAVT